MELISYALKIPKDAAPFAIAPIGDIQWAGKAGPTAQDTLRRHVDRLVSLGAWCVGTGDYIDFMSPSNRARLASANLYDTAEDVIDDKARELTHEVYDSFLRPLNGKFLGAVEGHHFTQLRDGTTSDQLLCGLLATRFLGSSAFIRLAFREDAARISSPGFDVVMLVHHGCGGGSLAGAPLNRLEKWGASFGGADVVIMGHTTKMGATPINRIYPVWGGREYGLDHRRIYLVNAGGFCRSYVPGQTMGRVSRGLYPEVGMMGAAALGAPIIHITPRREGKSWTKEIAVEV